MEENGCDESAFSKVGSRLIATLLMTVKRAMADGVVSFEMMRVMLSQQGVGEWSL